MAITLLVTDKSLSLLGDPLDGWTELSAELLWNEPGAGALTVPAHSETAALLQPGRRLVVIRDEDIWMAGPIEEPQNYEWSVDGEPSPGLLKVTFTDDLARIAGFVTYPDPALAFGSQVTTADVNRVIPSSGTQNAELIIRQLVDENCGPGAISTRRIEQLVLDTVAGVGTATAITTRLEPVLDACRTVAAGGGGLGFRTRQVGSEIRFGVYAPVDRTATARFSRDIGNLRSVSFTLGAPLATSELVQGGDTGDRAYVEVTSGAQADWWRVEKLVDQSGTTDTNGELTQAGNLELGNDNPTAALSTVCVDTDDLKAGRDYGLGDRVSVVPYSGMEIADVVRSMRLEATPDGGELVTTTVGNDDSTTEAQLVRQIRDLARRLGRLETRR
ncbi:siphovirus ReqiPepy6 Gp37-like family protein [Streptomyces synnematoformans]|uniref:Gp28/Gp37-like domain-containing protein n=1 Tax=Streptomyces synnematoformans TaxID=415721 RepID=A0ABN2XAK1_9ACTN